MMKQLYQDNFDTVYYVVKRFGLREEEIEEIAQEAFLRLHEKGPTDPNQARGFLIITARNMAIDLLRKNKRQKVGFIEDNQAAIDSDEAVWKNDPRRIMEAEAVGKFLDEIKDEQGADILVMFYRDGMTAKQIAERLNEGVNTVTSRLSRARKKFKERLQKIIDQNWRMET